LNRGRSFGPGSDAELLVAAQSLEAIFPDAQTTPVTLVDYVYTNGGMPMYELTNLCQIVRRCNPKVIFEFGTFLGETTSQIAANSEAEVYTLDLPPPGHKHY
jgi:predicted O-methyltransferase YrrM